jgi:myosin heavy subunit
VSSTIVNACRLTFSFVKIATPRTFSATAGIDASFESKEITTKDATEISQQLHARLCKENPFTQIGSRLMVSVRPLRGLPLYSDQSSKEYAQNAKQVINGTQNTSQSLPPHVFNVSAAAYLHALVGKMDQSIVLL